MAIFAGPAEPNRASPIIGPRVLSASQPATPAGFRSRVRPAFVPDSLVFPQPEIKNSLVSNQSSSIQQHAYYVQTVHSARTTTYNIRTRTTVNQRSTAFVQTNYVTTTFSFSLFLFFRANRLSFHHTVRVAWIF